MTPEEADRIIERITLLYTETWRSKTVDEMNVHERKAAITDATEALLNAQANYQAAEDREEQTWAYEAAWRANRRIEELGGRTVSSSKLVANSNFAARV